VPLGVEASFEVYHRASPPSANRIVLGRIRSMPYRIEKCGSSQEPGYCRRRGGETSGQTFIFRVASANLTAAQQPKIATAIQGAVLSELAQLDLGPGATAPAVGDGFSGDLLYLPTRWYGGLIIPGEVAAAEKTQLVVTAQ